MNALHATVFGTGGDNKKQERKQNMQNRRRRHRYTTRFGVVLPSIPIILHLKRSRTKDLQHAKHAAWVLDYKLPFVSFNPAGPVIFIFSNGLFPCSICHQFLHLMSWQSNRMAVSANCVSVQKYLRATIHCRVERSYGSEIE